jgi:RNA polymerase sigma-70 factor (ECF subfamily)
MVKQLIADSFTDFVRETEPRLMHALAAALGAQRGLDATADALAYGWEHWDRVGAMENPAGYLYRVGYRRGIRQRRRPILPTVEPHEMPWIEPGLPAALAALTTKQRVAVLLVHAFGWTYAETARVTGVSISTVEKHIERGLKKLRARLGGGS